MFLLKDQVASRKPLQYRADRDLPLSEQSSVCPWWKRCNHGGSFWGQCWPGKPLHRESGARLNEEARSVAEGGIAKLLRCSPAFSLRKFSVVSSVTFLTTNLFPPHNTHLDRMSLVALSVIMFALYSFAFLSLLHQTWTSWMVGYIVRMRSFPASTTVPGTSWIFKRQVGEWMRRKNKLWPNMFDFFLTYWIWNSIGSKKLNIYGCEV